MSKKKKSISGLDMLLVMSVILAMCNVFDLIDKNLLAVAGFVLMLTTIYLVICIAIDIVIIKFGGKKKE